LIDVARQAETLSEQDFLSLMALANWTQRCGSCMQFC